MDNTILGIGVIILAIFGFVYFTQEPAEGCGVSAENVGLWVDGLITDSEILAIQDQCSAHGDEAVCQADSDCDWGRPLMIVI